MTTGAVPVALTGPVGGLMMPLLGALGAPRGMDVVASALPDRDAPLGLGGLAAAMARLGFDVAWNARGRERWRAPMDGALLVRGADGAVAAFVKQAGRISGVAPEGGAAPGLDAALTRAQEVVHLRAGMKLPLTEFDEDLHRVLAGGLAVSLAANLVALAVPLLTMFVYDRVIGGSATDVLPGLALGGALAIAAIFMLRRARARLLAAAYARFGYALQVRLAQRMLRAPLAVGGRFQRHAVQGRLQEAWRAVAPLSHAMSTALFDAPFILLSLVAVGFVGGMIVMVPLAYLVLFLGIGLLLDQRSRLAQQVAGVVSAEREAMLGELAARAEDLRMAGLEQAWLARFAEVSRRAALLAVGEGMQAAVTQALATGLGLGMALATLAVGVDLVLGGSMTAGGLVATMLLVWRITGPAQAVFYSIGRLRQAGAQRQRLEALLQMPVEADQSGQLHRAPAGVPSLRLDRVTLRHSSAPDPALSGVSLDLMPGEVVAVTGPTGSGKTTLLQVAAGLLAPQFGAVLLDGRTLAQIDPDEVRLRVIGFAAAGPAGLARLDMEQPPIAILDAPPLGGDGQARFEAFLARRRGRASTLFATADPALAALADRIVVLKAGAAVATGTPARPMQETTA